MGGLENQLASYVLWQPLADKKYKDFVPLGRSISETGELLAEVYHARSPLVKDAVTLKIIIGGSVAERDAIANIAGKRNLETILTQYMVDTVEHDGKKCVVIPYKHIEGTSLEKKTVTAEEFRQQLLHLARDLRVVQKEGFALADIRPSNILIDKQGKAYFIDFDAGVRFGEVLHRESEGFTHHKVRASEETDTYSFLKTIEWVAKKNGFSGNNTFYALVKAAHEWGAEDKAVTLDQIINILEEPDRQQKQQSRRTFIRRVFGMAAASAVGTAFVTHVYNRELYKKSENAALDEMKRSDGTIDASREMQRRLGRALAHKIGDLVEEGAFSVIGSSNTIGRYAPDGEILEVDAYYPQAGAVTELLYVASTVDKRALALARIAARTQASLINSAGEQAFEFASPNNRNVWGLRYAFEDTQDTQYLDAMFMAASSVRKHTKEFDRFMLPWTQDAEARKKPIIVYDDANNMFTLLAGLYVQQKVRKLSITGKEKYLEVDFKDTIHKLSSALVELIEDNRAKLSITYEVNPAFRSPFSPAHAQAEVAYALFEGGKALDNPELLLQSAALVQPLLTDPLIKRFGVVDENPVTKRLRQNPDLHNYGGLARAFRHAKAQQPDGDYTTILGILHPQIPRAEFEGSVFKKIVRKQKELLTGVCLPQKGWCPIGHPQSDADLLYALLV